jgi:hypothetical protein
MNSWPLGYALHILTILLVYTHSFSRMSPDFAKKLAESQALQASRGQGAPGLATPASPTNSQKFDAFKRVSLSEARVYGAITVAPAAVRAEEAESDTDPGGTVTLLSIKESKAKT